MVSKSREEMLQYTCSKRLVSKCPPKCLNVAGTQTDDIEKRLLSLLLS